MSIAARVSIILLTAAAIIPLLAGAARPPVPDPLAAVHSWTYQLQSLDLDRLARDPADMLVIDFSQSMPSGQPMRPLSAAEVARLQKKPNGSRRLVIAYLSIGEAEEYRYYWNRAWKETPPDWLVAENCRWPRNHIVSFWQDGWKDIMIRGPQSYLGRIRAAGFDGVYLDRIDAYSDLASREPRAREHMVDFVVELAGHARRGDRPLLVIAQNAEELLEDARYRAAVDAIAKEDLLYGVYGTGKRNPVGMVGGSMALLQKLQKEGKQVFAVEYLTTDAAIAAARVELAASGIVSVFPSRALDGGSPFTPPPPGEYGTPEFAAANCDGIWKKAASIDQRSQTARP